MIIKTWLRQIMTLIKKQQEYDAMKEIINKIEKNDDTNLETA